MGWIGKRGTDVFPLQCKPREGVGYGEEKEGEGEVGEKGEGEGVRGKGGRGRGKRGFGCSISFFTWKHTVPGCPTHVREGWINNAGPSVVLAEAHKVEGKREENAHGHVQGLWDLQRASTSVTSLDSCTCSTQQAGQMFSIPQMRKLRHQQIHGLTVIQVGGAKLGLKSSAVSVTSGAYKKGTQSSGGGAVGQNRVLRTGFWSQTAWPHFQLAVRTQGKFLNFSVL